MSIQPALRAAIDLMLMPSKARLFQRAPLPEQTGELLSIVAGDTDALARAAKSSGRAPEMVREAATFFVEQVLLHSESDCYRVLGGTAQCTTAELRRNMAMMMTWLHPDTDRGGDRSVFASRVTNAWDTLKTPERRAAYDAEQRAKVQQPVARPRASQGHRAHQLVPHRAEPTGAPRSLLSRLLGALRFRNRRT